MSSIYSVSSNATSYSTNSTSTANSSLDFDEFMELLSAELQYQDPTEPVDSTEYISQMCQITSLAALDSLNTSVNNNSAYSLIGKTVTYSGTDSLGNSVSSTGKVDSVVMYNGTAYLNINDLLVPLEGVVEVSGDTADTTDPDGTSAA